MRKHVEAESLRTYSVKSGGKGPGFIETAVGLVIGFGGVAYVAYSLYHLFIA